MTAGAWTTENLRTQGYSLTTEEARRLAVGLRFPTGLCLALVVLALVAQSEILVAALVPVGAIAGWTSRHPFDYIWNRAARHLLRAPELPPNPARRRHAFKLATVWLAAVTLLFAAEANTAALALGGVLVAVCAIVTATNFCVPSTILVWLGDRRGKEVPT